MNYYLLIKCTIKSETKWFFLLNKGVLLYNVFVVFLVEVIKKP